MVRSFTLGLVAVACASIAAGMLAATACITAPPPQLPEDTEHRPTILDESVVPPEGVILTQLPPGGFVVPVLLEDPNESFQWDVFIDYNACLDPPYCTEATPPVSLVNRVQPTPETLDGGVVVVEFEPPTDLDPTQCHKIDFLVAHAFESTSPRAYDPIGGDIATWIYDPGGATPCGSLVYDAGALQDGAFPPVDAPSEALPVVPESGTD